MPLLSRAAFSVAVFGLVALSLPAHAQPATGKPDAADAAALDACQRSAKQSLTTKGVPPLEVTLNAPQVLPGPSGDSTATLRGTGRWRGASGVRNFNYSCNVDLRTSEAVGLVMQDVSPPAVAAPQARAPSEPNLSELSPSACESSAVEVLQQRWPRATEISFDAATRSFRQPSAVSAALHGSMRARPAPGSPQAVLGFDCEIDPRDGRVLHTNVSG